MPKPLPLRLNLRREFSVQIAAGGKTVEYRQCTPWWRRRLEGRKDEAIQFRNGCATKAPRMQVEFRGLRRIRKSGARCYAIQLGRVLRIKRWK